MKTSTGDPIVIYWQHFSYGVSGSGSKIIFTHNELKQIASGIIVIYVIVHGWTVSV